MEILVLSTYRGAVVAHFITKCCIAQGGFRLGVASASHRAWRLVEREPSQVLIDDAVSLLFELRSLPSFSLFELILE